MSRLQHVQIHRFRGLREVHLKELGQVNLLVGPNNAGKTSVLEALALYSAPLDPLAWVNTALRREGERSEMSVVEALRWLFPQAAAQPELYQGEIHLSGSGPVTELRASLQELVGTEKLEQRRAVLEEQRARLEQRRAALEQQRAALEQQRAALEQQREAAELTLVQSGTAVAMERSAQDLQHRLEFTQYEAINLTMAIDQLSSSNDDQAKPPRGVHIQVSAQRGASRKSRDFEVWEDERFRRTKGSVPAGWSLPHFAITPFARRVASTQLHQFSDATAAGLRGEVLTALQLLDPQIQGLEILVPSGNQAGLYVRHAQAGLSPVASFGDGLRRALVYALSLPGLRGGLLLIDELEAALHVSALARLFGWLVTACAQHDVQLFATTHSLEALDAVLGAPAVDQGSIVGYHIDSNAAEPVTRYDGSMLHRLRYDRGLDIR